MRYTVVGEVEGPIVPRRRCSLEAAAGKAQDLRWSGIRNVRVLADGFDVPSAEVEAAYRRYAHAKRIRRLRSWALTLATTLPVMLLPLTVALILSPALILEAPGYFVLFYVLPFAAGLALWTRARQLERERPPG